MACLQRDVGKSDLPSSNYMAVYQISHPPRKISQLSAGMWGVYIWEHGPLPENFVF